MPDKSTLKAAESIRVGGAIASPGGEYMLTYQSDGNLVLYEQSGNGGHRAAWSSHTDGQGTPGVCRMQEDGNLVIYDGDGRPRWASGTAGHPGSRLELQDDGNAVILDPANAVLWRHLLSEASLEHWVVETIRWEEDENRRFAIEYTAPILSRLVGPPSAGSKILSVGCGVGTDVEALAELGWDAYGVEPGDRRAAWSRRRDQGRLYVADGRELPFPDASFDAVTAYGVIEHVGAIGASVQLEQDYWHQRVRFARELARVTRPAGAMVLSTPNRLCPIDFFHFSSRFGGRWHSPREPFSVSYGDIKELFVDGAGCRDVTPLGMRGAFVFNRSREHLWGRVLVPLARLGVTAFGW